MPSTVIVIVSFFINLFVVVEFQISKFSCPTTRDPNGAILSGSSRPKHRVRRANVNYYRRVLQNTFDDMEKDLNKYWDYINKTVTDLMKIFRSPEGEYNVFEIVAAVVVFILLLAMLRRFYVMCCLKKNRPWSSIFLICHHFVHFIRFSIKNNNRFWLKNEKNLLFWIVQLFQIFQDLNPEPD